MSADADRDLIGQAKRTVDLPGFLAQRGWTPGKSDSARWRYLSGPDGQRLLLHRATEGGDWLWRDADDRGTKGNIYHLIQRLDGGTHGQIMAAIRRAVASPPPTLEFRRGGHSTAATRQEPRQPRSLPTVDEEGTRYLTETRSLHPDTVAAFSHSLGSLPGAVVVAVHNARHDGEEKGPQEPGRFTGSRDDGPGRGRSLWVSQPGNQGVPETIIVADGFLDAMSAWEFCPEDVQKTIAVASTGGTPSEAGDTKLKRILARMVEAHGERITPVLLDASDVGEADEAKRATWLQGLAAEAGVEYRRLAPPQGKDWNECLTATKRAQEAAQAAATVAACYPAPEEPDEPEKAQKRRQGRGPSR